jgi:hypothetical protein
MAGSTASFGDAVVTLCSGYVMYVLARFHY